MDPEPLVKTNEKTLDRIRIQDTNPDPKGVLHPHSTGRIWKPCQISFRETGLTTLLIIAGGSMNSRPHSENRFALLSDLGFHTSHA